MARPPELHVEMALNKLELMNRPGESGDRPGPGRVHPSAKLAVLFENVGAPSIDAASRR